MEAIGAIRAVEPVIATTSPVAAIGAPVEPSPPPTYARSCTAFDRYPCILDPVAASIAAAAAAQDLRTFQLSQARMRRPADAR